MNERLTAAEVAERYGVNARTVARWCAQGRLPGAYKVGEGFRGIWVIPASALEGFEPPTRGPQPKR